MVTQHSMSSKADVEKKKVGVCDHGNTLVVAGLDQFLEKGTGV